MNGRSNLESKPQKLAQPPIGDSQPTADWASRLRGLLLGTALGDALGLPMEGLTPKAIRHRYGGSIDRFHLFGQRGFVSDDTEQTALVCQSFIRAAGTPHRFRAHLRWALIGWFWRLPFGIGFATLRACLGLAFGRQRGVASAGNGAMMRSPVLGAVLAHDSVRRRRLIVEAAELTHTHSWSVDSAVFAAELAARCVRSTASVDRAGLVRDALASVSPSELVERVECAIARAISNQPYDVESLGNTGFVLHTAPLTAFCFIRFGDEPIEAIRQAIALGGDTDTHAAIVGAWTGGLHGEDALPSALVSKISDGPFGPSHLRALADAITLGTKPPRYSWLRAMIRNLLLYPVVVKHGVSRLWLRK